MEDFKKNIGLRIKEARERAGLTQAALAEHTSVKAASISSYEKGVSLPSVTALVAIAKTCNISLDWLCDTENSDNITTLKDLFKVLLNLKQSIDWLEVDITEEETETIEKQDEPDDIPFCKTYSNYTLGLTASAKIETFSTEDTPVSIIVDFFKDWKKMNALLNSNTIDEEIFNLWIEKALNKAKNYTLPYKLNEAEEYDIPF